MWIRSQDKELLVNVDKFNVTEEDYYHTFTINSVIGTSGYYELGEYKTKKRALEVLDEIQKAIEDLPTDTTMYEVMTPDFDLTKCNFSKVFQMPRE